MVFSDVTLLGDSYFLRSLHFPCNQNQNVAKKDVIMTLLLHRMLGWEPCTRSGRRSINNVRKY